MIAAVVATAGPARAESRAPITLPGLLAAGAGAPDLDDRAVRRAIRFNNRRWRGVHRAELLQWLRSTDAADATATSEFEPRDIRRIAQLQRGAGLPAAAIDGRIGKSTAAVMLFAGLELSPVRAGARRIELWFYPGSFEDLDGWRRAAATTTPTAPDAYREVKAGAPDGSGLIYVVVDDNVVDVIDARGGPPLSLASGTHSADPSKPGRYRLATGKPHRTDNWLYSQIPWGAELREQDGEIQFRPDGERRWKWATGPKSALSYPLPRTDFYGDDGTLMTRWQLNDFGALAWRLRGSPGLLIHTSPLLEEKAARGRVDKLPTSHGCLHVKPDQRDRLVDRGYLKRGVTVVIKRYRDHLLPRKLLATVAAHRGT